MKKLIVNADDFGYTQGVTQGIIEGFVKGIVSSTTVMANSPNLEASIHLGMKVGLPIGLHVNLTKGKPCSPWKEVYSLVDEKGEFFSCPRSLVVHSQRCHLEKEIWAQLKKVLKTGVQVTHIDSHHHIHGNRLIEEALVKVATETGLPIRSLNGSQRGRFNKSQIKTPIAFIEDFRGDDASLEYWERVLQSLPLGVTEFMCHPGIPNDDKLGRISSYHLERGKELNFLLNPIVRELLDHYKVSLVSYQDLS